MKLLPLAALLGFCAVAAPALAQRVSTVDATGVLGQCERNPAPLCEAYLVGFADSESARTPKRFCIPGPATPAEMRVKVVKYLRTRLANLTDNGARQVVNALAYAYPCSK